MNASESVGGDPGRTAGARFIDPDVLARIDNLELIARVVVDGFISGLHRAVYRGVSTDFAEYRAYVPGDDVRHIDWRVYARTDRLYLKTYEAETNADLILALDVSKSMTFGSGAVSKLDYARYVCASLAHLGARQRDRVGLMTFDADLIEYLPPSGRQRNRIMRSLDRLETGGRSDFGAAIKRLSTSLRKRGIVVVLSDLYAQPETVSRALDQLRLRGNEVMLIHVLDPLELDLNLDQITVLEDLESGEQLATAPSQRDAYQQLMSKHLDTLTTDCGERGIDYACFNTAQPIDFVLFRYLADRARFSRVR